MELIFRGTTKKKKIEIEKGIITISSSEEETILENLYDDYDINVIDNTNLFFAGDDLVSEIFLYNEEPDIEFVTTVMRAVDYDTEFLNEKISTLSLTDKIYINMFRELSYNKEIVVFKNFLKGIDLIEEKKFEKLLKYLVGKKKVVILLSEDVDILYKYGEYSLISNKTNIKYGKTDDIYTDVDTLIKYKLDVPTLSYITYKAKKDKNVKLFYSKDVRDIIKDVYKHV